MRNIIVENFKTLQLAKSFADSMLNWSEARLINMFKDVTDGSWFVIFEH